MKINFLGLLFGSAFGLFVGIVTMETSLGSDATDTCLGRVNKQLQVFTLGIAL